MLGVENKFKNLFEEGARHKLICGFPETVQYYTTLLKKLEKDNRVKQFFNTDLSHVQQYLFHRLKVEPISKVEVQYDGSKLVELTKVEDEDDTSPPPFSLPYVNVQTTSGKINPEDPVVIIKSRYEDVSDPQQSVETLLDSAQEKDIFGAFYSYVQDKDPDIFIS